MIQQHPFSEVIVDVTSKFKKIKTSNYQKTGMFEIVDQGKSLIAGYTNDESLVSHIVPVIVFGDHTRAIKYVDAPVALGADGAKALQVETTIAWPKYVYYFLKTVNIAAAGYSRHFKFLKDIQIPIPYRNGSPDIEDQKRIAYLLSKVERLIAQRKQHLQQLDDLLKSVFLDMFGDPMRNEKGWTKKLLSDVLAEVESGKSPKCEARPANNEEWGVLKLGAVTTCVYKEGDNKALPTEVLPHSRFEVKVGDVLFSRKNTYELVAACAYVFATRPKLLMPDLIFRLVISDPEEINPIYLWRLLVSPSQRRAVQSTASGAAGSMPNISKANLKQLQIPCPPISIQNRFAAIVGKVEEAKTLVQDSLVRVETLFAVLSDQAFKGELNLVKVIIPRAEDEPSMEIVARHDEASSLESTFELPAPAKGKNFKNSKNRKSALKSWLTAYSKHLGEQPIDADFFIGLVKQKLSGLESESDIGWYSHEIGVAEYDEIKKWIFEELEGNRLSQFYDDKTNRVRVSAVKD